jgi:hypothetical protein
MPEESLVSRTFQYKIIKIVVGVVLSLLVLMPMATETTWFQHQTVHQHALHMLTAFYDHDGDWEAYRASLQVYIDRANIDTDEPIIVMEVPDPAGVPFNNNKISLTPYGDYLNTDTSKYRPEEKVELTLTAKRNNFKFKIAYSTRR